MRMKKQKKGSVLLICLLIIVLITVWIGFCGYQWSWGPFAKLHDVKTAKLPGNAPRYDVNQVTEQMNSNLKGKHIVFLGSSVTYGAAAQGVSFADYIGARNGCLIIKEAVSGTTLVESGIDSYVSRLRKLDRDLEADIFVCQLSTNDATQKKMLGSISDSFDISDFDTATVAGAIEYIIAYAKSTWNCQVVFYTNPEYASKEYADMVTLLHDIQDKWGIAIIDMWSDECFNATSQEQRDLYMADSIHPTKAGYLEWWTPYMEAILSEALENE